MSDNEIKKKAKEILSNLSIDDLVESCFFDIFRAKIALVKEKYFEYLRNNTGTCQAITNCSIDFGLSEGTVTRYIYQYKETKF